MIRALAQTVATRKMLRKFSFVLAVVPLLLIGTVSCDQKAASDQSTPKPKKKPLISPDILFKDARDKMISGQFDDAADDFGKITAEQKVRQPLLSWIDFHQGLALLLAGRTDEARLAFTKIEERGPFTKAGSDAAMADFMVNLAHQLRDKEPTPAAAGKDFDKWSYEGIALLALGMKDWDLDKFDEATSLFRQFGEVMPEKMVDWADGPPDLAKLKDIANNFVNDYTEFAPARKDLDAASTPEEQMAAVEKAKTARSRMKLTTKMSKSLDASIADIGPKNKASDEEIAADNKAFTDAKQKHDELLAKFQFSEAHDAILDPKLKSEKLQDTQEALGKKTKWLATFKTQLIEDLTKSGYAKPIARKAGEALPGGVAKADEQQLTVNTARGPAPLAWSDLSLDSALAMGQSFIAPDMPPELAAFRKWHLGVFAIYAGKQKEGLALLNEAADLKPVFKDEMPLFQGGKIEF
jgi:hypothetical protein